MCIPHVEMHKRKFVSGAAVADRSVQASSGVRKDRDGDAGNAYSVTFTYSSGVSAAAAPMLKYCIYALSRQSLSAT